MMFDVDIILHSLKCPSCLRGRTEASSWRPKKGIRDLQKWTRRRDYSVQDPFIFDSIDLTSGRGRRFAFAYCAGICDTCAYKYVFRQMIIREANIVDTIASDDGTVMKPDHRRKQHHR